MVDFCGDTKIIPKGWTLKMTLTGETVNIFLPTGISKWKVNSVYIEIVLKKKVREP